MQDEDDIMICQCKKLWPSDPTTSGCGPNCLNRMLNIECVTVSMVSGSSGSELKAVVYNKGPRE